MDDTSPNEMKTTTEAKMAPPDTALVHPVPRSVLKSVTRSPNKFGPQLPPIPEPFPPNESFSSYTEPPGREVETFRNHWNRRLTSSPPPRGSIPVFNNIFKGDAPRNPLSNWGDPFYPNWADLLFPSPFPAEGGADNISQNMRVKTVVEEMDIKIDQILGQLGANFRASSVENDQTNRKLSPNNRKRKHDASANSPETFPLYNTTNIALVNNSGFTTQLGPSSRRIKLGENELDGFSNSISIVSGDYYFPYSHELATKAKLVKKIGSGGTGTVCLVYP